MRDNTTAIDAPDISINAVHLPTDQFNPASDTSRWKGSLKANRANNSAQNPMEETLSFRSSNGSSLSVVSASTEASGAIRFAANKRPAMISEKVPQNINASKRGNGISLNASLTDLQ
jgi:hypothetical protein